MERDFIPEVKDNDLILVHMLMQRRRNTATKSHVDKTNEERHAQRETKVEGTESSPAVR